MKFYVSRDGSGDFLIHPRAPAWHGSEYSWDSDSWRTDETTELCHKFATPFFKEMLGKDMIHKHDTHTLVEMVAVNGKLSIKEVWEYGE